MSVLDSDSNTLVTIIEDPGVDEAQVAAAAARSVAGFPVRADSYPHAAAEPLRQVCFCVIGWAWWIATSAWRRTEVDAGRQI